MGTAEACLMGGGRDCAIYIFKMDDLLCGVSSRVLFLPCTQDFAGSCIGWFQRDFADVLMRRDWKARNGYE